jgi:hypothetical protein
VTENLEMLSEEELERMLLDATSRGVPGRAAMARVTAIRTILSRRARRSSDDAERHARRALELVNATRGPDAQLPDLHPADVASVLANGEWASLVVSDDEMRSAQCARAITTEGDDDGDDA